MSYDTKCETLARDFLADVQANYRLMTDSDIETLAPVIAQRIQDAIEDELSAFEAELEARAVPVSADTP